MALPVSPVGPNCPSKNPYKASSFAAAAAFAARVDPAAAAGLRSVCFVRAMVKVKGMAILLGISDFMGDFLQFLILCHGYEKPSSLVLFPLANCTYAA
jgi:hypothetical protein